MNHRPPYLIVLCLIMAVAALCLSGCMSRGYEITYSQEFPDKMPRTVDPEIFTYYDVSVDKIYEAFFKDYIILGRSAFEGPYSDPADLAEFASGVGAHVVVTAVTLTQEHSHEMTYEMPMTPAVSTAGGNTGPAGFMTTGATSTQRMKMKVKKFDQKALFLRKANKNPAIWEMNISQFEKTGTSELSGCWASPDGVAEVIVSEDQVLGFCVEPGPEAQGWKKGDLMFLLYEDEKQSGIYLMNDKTPQLTKYQLNKAGGLTLSLPLMDQRVQFERSAKCQN